MLVTIKTTTCHVCHAGTLAAPFYMKDLGPRDVGHVLGMTHKHHSRSKSNTRWSCYWRQQFCSTKSYEIPRPVVGVAHGGIKSKT